MLTYCEPGRSTSAPGNCTLPSQAGWHLSERELLKGKLAYLETRNSTSGEKLHTPPHGGDTVIRFRGMNLPERKRAGKGLEQIKFESP